LTIHLSLHNKGSSELKAYQRVSKRMLSAAIAASSNNKNAHGKI